MITIGIVSFNRLKYLKALFASIQNLDRSNFEVIVVDNGSWEKGLAEFLTFQKQKGYINKLFLRSTQERNWINDEYIAKNIVIENCKNDCIVFLQDDLQFIGDEDYLITLCRDFMESKFQCLEFNGIRKVTNDSKFFNNQNFFSNSGLRYWISDKSHYQTMGIFKKETFDRLGPYPTNWPKEKQYWGRSEDHYDYLVKQVYRDINISCHVPAFLGIWNDHRGGYAFFRNDLRYGDYLDPAHESGLYYEKFNFNHVISQQNSAKPLSFMDVARPLGWKLTTSLDGDQAKYSQNDIVAIEQGKLI